MPRAADVLFPVTLSASGPPAHAWRIGVRGLLNVASLALVVAIVAGVADSELLLDAFWVTLVIGAFLFTLRVALLRVALGSLFILAHFVVEAGGLAGIELTDLAEWPLLLVILILVTLMADRVGTTTQPYASPYRQAGDRLGSAHEEERGRLGRDLHDSVGQTLTAVMLTLGAADAAVRAAPDAPASTTPPAPPRGPPRPRPPPPPPCCRRACSSRSARSVPSASSRRRSAMPRATATRS